MIFDIEEEKARIFYHRAVYPLLVVISMKDRMDEELFQSFRAFLNILEISKVDNHIVSLYTYLFRVFYDEYYGLGGPGIPPGGAVNINGFSDKGVAVNIDSFFDKGVWRWGYRGMRVNGVQGMIVAERWFLAFMNSSPESYMTVLRKFSLYISQLRCSPRASNINLVCCKASSPTNAPQLDSACSKRGRAGGKSSLPVPSRKVPATCEESWRALKRRGRWFRSRRNGAEDGSDDDDDDEEEEEDPGDEHAHKQRGALINAKSKSSKPTWCDAFR